MCINVHLLTFVKNPGGKGRGNNMADKSAQAKGGSERTSKRPSGASQEAKSAAVTISGIVVLYIRQICTGSLF